MQTNGHFGAKNIKKPQAAASHPFNAETQSEAGAMPGPSPLFNGHHKPK